MFFLSLTKINFTKMIDFFVFRPAINFCWIVIWFQQRLMEIEMIANWINLVAIDQRHKCLFESSISHSFCYSISIIHLLMCRDHILSRLAYRAGFNYSDSQTPSTLIEASFLYNTDGLIAFWFQIQLEHKIVFEPKYQLKSK